MIWFKRQMVTFFRIIWAGTRNIFRNAWLTTAATAIMVVTLSILLFAAAINISLNDTIEDITKDVTLSVYLKDNITEIQKLDLQNKFLADENVGAVTFRSQEEALQLFKERNQSNEEILKGLSLIDNKLPASFEIMLVDLTQFDSVVGLTQSDEFKGVIDGTSADQNEDRKKSIDRIAGAQDFIVQGSIVAAAIFAFLSTLIIFNTIRMAIFTRSYEIEIMKLIGATPGYIRGPFLVEASMYGVVAGIISFVITFSTIKQIGPRVATHIKIENTMDYFSQYWFAILGASILLGILIGFLSSSFAMFKYLRLKKW